VQFRVLGARDAKSGNINGDLEIKLADKKRGLTLTQSWLTSNVLRNHVECVACAPHSHAAHN
jgi:voltage-dependent anion channel protein 2